MASPNFGEGDAHRGALRAGHGVQRPVVEDADGIAVTLRTRTTNQRDRGLPLRGIPRQLPQPVPGVARRGLRRQAHRTGLPRPRACGPLRRGARRAGGIRSPRQPGGDRDANGWRIRCRPPTRRPARAGRGVPRSDAVRNSRPPGSSPPCRNAWPCRSRTPRLTDLAAELHLTRRTLRRRCRAAGTSFRALHDGVRERVACGCWSPASCRSCRSRRRSGSTMRAISAARSKLDRRLPREMRRQCGGCALARP